MAVRDEPQAQALFQERYSRRSAVPGRAVPGRSGKQAALGQQRLKGVHLGEPRPGAGAHGDPACGTAVPIMQSRVTSALRASSVRPSVPAGRIGTTR
jgi:hypothetical protein